MTTAGFPGIFPGGLTTGYANCGGSGVGKNALGSPKRFPGGLTDGYITIGAAQKAPSPPDKTGLLAYTNANDTATASAAWAAPTPAFPGIMPGGLTISGANIGAVGKIRLGQGFPQIFPGGTTTGYSTIGAIWKTSALFPLTSSITVNERGDVGIGSAGMVPFEGSVSKTETGDRMNSAAVVPYDGIPALQQTMDLFITGFTYTRPDTTTCATRIDSSMELQLVAANSTPLDYTWGDAAYLSEEARTNYCINSNMTPANTNGLSVTGTATVQTVTDSSALTSAKLANAVTGNVFQASGGASGGTVIISGAIGSTGKCSASLYARDITGTGASFGITASPSATSISGGAYARYKAELLTPGATSDTFVITIPAGVIINFILNQLERGNRCTSVIKVAGATATRAATVLKRTDIASQTWFNKDSGGVILDLNVLEDEGQTGTQFVMMAGSNGSFPTDDIIIITNPLSSKATVSIKGNSITTNTFSPNVGFMIGKRIPCAGTWQSGGFATTIVGAASYGTAVAINAPPASITTLNLGNAASSTAQFNGWIHSATFFNECPSLAQIAKYMLGTNAGFSERGVLLSGQSNAENIGNGTSLSNFSNAGERALRAMIETIIGSSSTTRYWAVNGATGGTSAYTDWQSGGRALVKWQNVVTAYLGAGGVIDAIWWDQGEADVGQSAASLETVWGGIFTTLRDFIFNIAGYRPPVFVVPLGKFVDGGTYSDSVNTSAQQMRLAQHTLSSLQNFVTLMMEKFHQPLIDAIVHLTSAGYSSHAQNGARFIYKALGYNVSGGVNGPSINSATGIGNTLTVNVTQDIGATDLSTHSFTADGWRFLQNNNVNTPIAINSVNYVSPTQLIVVLASDPGQGNHLLEYSNDLLYYAVQANLIRDNSPYNLALKSFTTILSYVAAVSSLNGNDVSSISSTIFYSGGVNEGEARDVADISAEFFFDGSIDITEGGDSPGISGLTTVTTPDIRIFAAPSKVNTWSA